jgi:hypothetical protein
MFLVGVLISGDGPNVNRMNAIYVSYLLFSLEGFHKICMLIKKFNDKIGKVFSTLVVFLYMVCFALFAKYYFFDYADETYLLDYFNFELDESLDFLATLSPKILQRSTYISNVSCSYIYYYESTQTSPNEFNQASSDNENIQYTWTRRFKNYFFDYPETIDPTGNYIVPDVETSIISELRDYGFEETTVGKYIVFYNPLIDGVGKLANAVISWDHGMNDEGMLVLDDDDDNKTVLSGWALNTGFNKVWDDIFVQVGDKYYVADVMQRKDVANILDNDDYINCGFHVNIDIDVIKNEDSIRFICVDYSDKAYYNQTIFIN